MLIEWKTKYETGVADIDYEHHELVTLINTLFEELQSGGRAASVEHFFGELFRAISSHFALEETMMRKARYDGYEPHKADHEDLLDQLRDIMDAFEANPEARPVAALGETLDSWFTLHFQTHDARLHEAFGPHSH